MHHINNHEAYTFNDTIFEHNKSTTSLDNQGTSLMTTIHYMTTVANNEITTPQIGNDSMYQVTANVKDKDNQSHVFFDGVITKSTPLHVSSNISINTTEVIVNLTEECNSNTMSAYDGIRHDSTNPQNICRDNYTCYAIVYGFFIGGTVLFGALQSTIFYHTVISSSVKLHNTMFAHLLRVPMTFFDTNPLGKKFLVFHKLYRLENY